MALVPICPAGAPLSQWPLPGSALTTAELLRVFQMPLNNGGRFGRMRLQRFAVTALGVALQELQSLLVRRKLRLHIGRIELLALRILELLQLGRVLLVHLRRKRDACLSRGGLQFLAGLGVVGNHHFRELPNAVLFAVRDGELAGLDFEHVRTRRHGNELLGRDLLCGDAGRTGQECYGGCYLQHSHGRFLRFDTERKAAPTAKPERCSRAFRFGEIA